MKNNTGITIIELLISVTIFSMMALAITLIFQGGIEMYISTQKTSELVNENEKSLYWHADTKGILWDIRISSAVTDVQTAQLDLVYPDNTAVSYYKTADDLVRQEDASAEVIADNVNSISFDYYSITNGLISSTTEASDVDIVSVDIEMEKDEKTLRTMSSARIRNR